jgi:DNA-3-methyladenine glycosylase
MVLEITTSLYEKPDRSFYENDNVVQVAKDLIGMVLVTNVDGVLTAGRIVETEAYCGRGDKACHANNKRTPRTETMYGEGGRAYVYLCYGIHHLFNVVTNVKDKADAVLIRALEPVVGLDEMKIRRNDNPKLASGPGTLTQALGINTHMDGIDLTGDTVWIAKNPFNDKIKILTDRRVGVDYAGEDALKPWRFLLKGSKFISKKVQQ